MSCYSNRGCHVCVCFCSLPSVLLAVVVVFMLLSCATLTCFSLCLNLISSCFMFHIMLHYDCKNNTHYHEPCSNNYLCRVAVRNDIRFLGRAENCSLRNRCTNSCYVDAERVRATRSLSILLGFLSRRFVTFTVLSFGSCRLWFLLSVCHGESLTQIYCLFVVSVWQDTQQSLLKLFAW